MAAPEGLTPAQQHAHDRIENDLKYFARHALTIKTKEGIFKKFTFNSAQEYLDAKLEEQKKKIGKIRALIVKGRQQGCSTYVSARFYHKTTRKSGISTFILSHEAETTKKLFKMVERYNDNCPAPLRPAAKVANKREYVFDQINSDYAVGTAGNKDVGRGGTIQLFHGSEVAFWENTNEIQTVILQSIPDADNTEIILESTANGMGNMFYDMCMDAVNGIGDYIVVFIPWFWQAEYQRETPPDGKYELTPEEVELQLLYDLSIQQIYWRRAKIYEFKSEWKFKQEYPSNLMEAFQTSGDSLINSERIMMARKSKVMDNNAPMLMGVDPGRNRDRTVFVYRQGRRILRKEVFKFPVKNDTIQMQIAGLIAARIDQFGLRRVFVDAGEGNGICDRLIERGYGPVVERVYFGGEATNEVYLNKRAEMAGDFQDWVHGEEGEVSIPDEDEFHKEIVIIPPFKTTSSSRKQLVGKEELRKLFRKSPDIFDATILTFASKVRMDDYFDGTRSRITSKHNGKSPLKTLQKLRGQGRINSDRYNRFNRR
jgi:hypothetical protein